MRIFLDSFIASKLDSRKLVNFAVRKGNQIIVSNDIIDSTLFQHNLAWFEEHLMESEILCEIEQTPDEMVQKPFFWNSCSIETAPSQTLATAVQNFPNKDKILYIANLINAAYFQSPWTICQYSDPFCSEIEKMLGLEPSSEINLRPAVLFECRKRNLMHVFEEYNKKYVHVLAYRHNCSAVLESNGTIRMIN